MSEIDVNVIKGYSSADVVQMPTGVSGEYVQQLFDDSYNVTAIKPGDIITKGPWVDARAYGTSKNEVTIAAAISAITLMSPTNRTLVLAPGMWTISGSITVPTNITVEFLTGASMDVASGSSINFSGPVVAGPYRIFTGSGTITVGTATVLVYSAWDGTSGNTVTFQTFPLTPSSAPTSNYQVANKKYVDDLVAANLYIAPAGVISPYGGDTPPDGYLLCDGSAVSRTTYATLFAIIDTTFGEGDGSTTFNVPNLKGSVPVGKDALDANFTSLGQIGGSSTHSLSINEMPTHMHYHQHSFLYVYNYSTLSMPAGLGSGGAVYGFTWTVTETQIQDAGSTAAGGAYVGGNAAHNNLQPYVVVNYIIKY